MARVQTEWRGTGGGGGRGRGQESNRPSIIDGNSVATPPSEIGLGVQWWLPYSEDIAAHNCTRRADIETSHRNEHVTNWSWFAIDDKLSNENECKRSEPSAQSAASNQSRRASAAALTLRTTNRVLLCAVCALIANHSTRNTTINTTTLADANKQTIVAYRNGL